MTVTMTKESVYYHTGGIAIVLKKLLMVCEVMVWIHSSELLYLNRTLWCI